jgi:folate-binding protein YgfZ
MNQLAEPEWLADYRALTAEVGYAPLERTQIEFTGKDRASFLHNLCTNEIKKLAVGSGCEAFVTSVQGKTVGHGFIFAGPDSLVFDTEAGQGETLLKHFDHYLVCEQVELRDRSEDWAEVLLAGVKAEDVVATLFQTSLPAGRFANAIVPWEGNHVWIRRFDFAGNGFLLSIASEAADSLTRQLAASGVHLCSTDAMEAARIEQGFPRFGIDLSDKNLPQELARDNQAISFVKGCYLGQETVARIDALGHVNKSLVGLKFADSRVPEGGDELKVGENVVGHVTSATHSPRLGVPLALGYVKHGQEKPGTCFTSAAGDAEVITLPVAH